MRRVILTTFLMALTVAALHSQTLKKPLSIDDVVKWRRVTESAISPDGSLVAVKIEPWRGASTLKIFNNRGDELFSCDSAGGVRFTKERGVALFMSGEGKKSRLHIYNALNKKSRVIEGVRAVHNPSGWEDYLLYIKRDSTLVVETISGDKKFLETKIEDFKASEINNRLMLKFKESITLYSLKNNNIDTIITKSKKLSSLALSKCSNIALFLDDTDLMMWREGHSIEKIGNNVSNKRELIISPDGSKIYYGVNPPPITRDTSIKREDYPNVHIWHWNEAKQFTQQIVDKKRDTERSFLEVYNIEKQSSYRLTNNTLNEARLVENGNSSRVVLTSDEPYRVSSMWEGRGRYDVYIADTYLERLNSVATGVTGSVRVSPKGKYAYWYNSADSSWYTCSIANSTVTKITTPATIAAYDEENDVPDWPSSYSIAGWSRDDEYILIYDRYDLWRVDPKGIYAPINLTINGREKKITYRYISAEQSDSIDISGAMLFSGFDNITKGYGYYMAYEPGLKLPTVLISGNFMLGTPIKAKESKSYIYTRESFTEFPDIHFTSDNFKSSRRITEVNPQQRNFNWGTARLIKWTSYDGVELEGVLYLPENYDQTKRYPMIVNFYEKNSSTLHSYRTPEPHRSTIDYHMYTSNGYVVFNPDIVYKEGYPGESAFNSIMPGISAIINMGIADPAKIGAQGHSWGGYQTAYLATRTNLFAAIESGAPVVNMLSAYGGIRWGTGLNRSFQYEHQQSRIGKTPWESPLRYIENSPIYTMDKVTTPILIMHNDNDGHVPWYQGIEFFVALKRLRKPVWMLNYTGEVHWPQKLSNKIDFQIRMMQFFNHYLKGEPMPEWMAVEMTAIELEHRPGY